jgi:hypothetical protein
MMLLAVTVLDRLQLLTLHGGFTCLQLVESVDKVDHLELKNMLTDVFCVNTVMFCILRYITPSLRHSIANNILYFAPGHTVSTAY